MPPPSRLHSYRVRRLQDAVVLLRFPALIVANARLAGDSMPGSPRPLPVFRAFLLPTITSLPLRYDVHQEASFRSALAATARLTLVCVQEYQKGAIYRQMLEYKREKINLESRVQELEKHSTDHDDHIRVVDAWVLQVRLA